MKWIDGAERVVAFCGSSMEIGLSISLRSDLSQTAFLIACVCPIYSASKVDSATVGWRLEHQLMAPLPMLKTNPEVDRRVSRSPAQSASVLPVKGCRLPLYVNFRLIVPRR